MKFSPINSSSKVFHRWDMHLRSSNILLQVGSLKDPIKDDSHPSILQRSSTLFISIQLTIDLNFYISLEERHLKRLEFWKQLLEKNNAKTVLFSNVSLSKECSIGAGVGKSGLSYNYVILRNSARIELYIDTGDRDRNKRIYDQLYSKRQEIESDFGEKLEWQRLDDKRACRIAKTVENKGLWDMDDWPAIQDKMIDAMIRFKKALSKHIQQLR